MPTLHCLKSCACLERLGDTALDLGAYAVETSDHSDFAESIPVLTARRAERSVLICGAKVRYKEEQYERRLLKVKAIDMQHRLEAHEFFRISN